MKSTHLFKSIYFYCFLFFITHTSIAGTIPDCREVNDQMYINKNSTTIFTEKTAESGINYAGTTFGHAWSDINNDGYMDFVISNHGFPTLFINNQDGTFTTNPIEYFNGFEQDDSGNIVPRRYDLHGVGFGDINNDGFSDMYIPIGGDNGNSDGKENVLFINQGGYYDYVNQSKYYGLQDSIGRGRTPLFFDQNGDGHLDMFLNNLDRTDAKYKSSMYVSNGESTPFSKFTNTQLKLKSSTLYFSNLIHQGKTGKNLMLTVSEKGDQLTLYNTSTMPFVKNLATTLAGIRDVTVGDFNGDGLQDMFCVGNQWGPEAVQVNANELAIFLKAKSTKTPSINFKSDSAISLQLNLFPYKSDEKSRVFLGKTSYQPLSVNIILDKNNPINIGKPSCTILCVPGIYIWYDTILQNWNIENRDPTSSASSTVRVFSNSNITDLKTVNFLNSKLLSGDRMYLQNSNGNFTAVTNFLLGSVNKTSAVSVIAADFDNDMDLDLVLACQGEAINYSNLYYENNGFGKFTKINNFGGEGTLMGRSGASTVADYDNDGFMDFLVENGEGQIGEFGKALHFNNGPTQLFRNNGNGNNWIEIDLSSDISNKAAVGSVVYCYAGGKKQLRLKGSETHLFSQNAQRIHFGLGPNSNIDSLVVLWPNGDIDNYPNIAANQILAINQNTSSGRKGIFEETTNYVPEFSIYPNPNNGRFFIDGASEDNAIKKISIVNLSGQLVYDEQINIVANQEFEIASKLQSGIYFIFFELNNGLAKPIKFVKQ